MSDREKLSKIRELLENIVCTDEVDAGVVLLSSDGPTHYDPELKCQVYDHEHFSPLGDALIELYHLTDTENSDAGDSRDTRQPNAG